MSGDKRVRKLRCLVIGSCIYDFLCFVSRMPLRGETLVADRSERRVGGKGFNQAVALSRLGCDVTFIGAIGTDPLADSFRSFARTEGINFLAEVISSRPTGMAAPLVTTDGVSSIVVDTAAAMHLSEAHVANVLEERWDLVICHYEVPMNVLRMVIQECGRREIKVFCNPAPWVGATGLWVVRNAFAVVLNEVEGRHLLLDSGLDSGYLDAVHVARTCSGYCTGELLVLTVGAKGSIAIWKGATIICESSRTTVVDTTGAGDAFCAAFAFGVLEGWSPGRVLGVASSAAALACGRPGGADGMPTLGEVLNLASQHPLWS